MRQGGDTKHAVPMIFDSGAAKTGIVPWKSGASSAASSATEMSGFSPGGAPGLKAVVESV
jgi:hypothetical protein